MRQAPEGIVSRHILRPHRCLSADILKKKPSRSSPRRKANSLPSQWQCSLTPRISVWQQTEPPQKVSVAIFGALIAGLLVFLILSVVYVITGALGACALYLKGLHPSPGIVLTDPDLWMPMVITVAFAVVFVLFITLRESVVAFKFNATTRELTYSIDRPFRVARTYVVAFDRVESITAVYSTALATEGHFDVVIRTQKGLYQRLWMGHNIHMSMLSEHTSWLKQHLGDRVRPEMRLDN